MSIAQAAQLVRAQGRGNDSMLMHVTPSEVKALQGIAQAHGGSLTVNPQTGLPEAGFLEQVLPVVAGIGVGTLTMNPMLGAAVAGGLGYGLSGSLEQGLLSGIGAFGGASALSSLGAVGAGGIGAASAAPAATTATTAAGTTIGAGGAGTTIGTGALTSPLTAVNPVTTLGGSATTGLGPTLQAAQTGQLATAAAPGASTLTGAQQFANLGAMDKFSAIGKGFGSLFSNPSGTFSAMGGLSGQGANLAMMGAPLLGGALGVGQDTDIQTPPEQESYIRPAVYDPVTQTYTRLAPVKTSDWGSRSFADYEKSQGYQEGGAVEQRYQRPIRTVDPAVTEYNQMLMNQARQEYVQQQPMTHVPQLTPSLMAPPTPAPVASTEVNTRHPRLYDPATQTYKPNPDYIAPAPPPSIGIDRGNNDPYSLDVYNGGGGDGPSEGSGPGDGPDGAPGMAAGGGIASIPKFQAGGDMQSDAFVIPADVVSALGNGSTEAGLSVLNEYLGLAMPIEGEGDGLSDDIPATIEGEQPARVANGEAYIPPDIVAKLGEGDPERGSAKLYVMLDKIREAAHGKTKQQREVQPEKVMPA